MNVNNSVSINPYNNVSAPPSAQQQEDQIKMEQNKIQEKGIDISQMGMASSVMSGLSASEKAEITDFTKSVQQAKQSGNFDAAKLAQQAPDSINKLAEQLNLSTEDMLTNMPNKGQQGLISAGNTQGENTAIDAYLNVSGTEQSDSILDLFDFMSEDDKGKNKEKQSAH